MPRTPRGIVSPFLQIRALINVSQLVELRLGLELVIRTTDDSFEIFLARSVMILRVRRIEPD